MAQEDSTKIKELFNQAKEALADIVQMMEDFEDTPKQSLNLNPNSHTDCPAMAYLTKVFGIAQSCMDLLPLSRFEKTRRRLNLAQKVMSNTLVIRQILNSIDHIRDFKSLRLVNKQWHKEVDSALWRQSSEPRCSFSLADMSGFRTRARVPSIIFPDLNFEDDPPKTIEYFSNKLFQFPCTNFKCIGEDLPLSQTVEFFSKYGRWIKHLTLNIDEPTFSHVKILLAKKVPNLTTLTLHSASREIFQDSDLNSNFTNLPNLHVLTLPGGTPSYWRDESDQKYCSTIAKILKAAPNLKAIKSTEGLYGLPCNDVNSFWLREIMAADKLSLIQRLELRLVPECLNDIELLCTKKPRLVALSFNFSYDSFKIESSRIAALLNCFMDMTKDSLQELGGLGGITEVDRISGPLHFPVMSKVTTVKIRKMYSVPWNKLLPPRIKLQHIFPNLKNLDLGGPEFCCVPEYLQERLKKNMEVFINPNASDTLEKLSVPALYMNYKPPLKLKKAASMYPNLKILNVALEMDPPGPNFRVTCQTIWKFFPNLEVLKLHCEYPNGREHKDDAHLTAEFDSAVTGVDPETCRKIAEILEQDFDRWNPYEFEREYLKDMYQLGPSIKKLMNLREFRVNGWNDDDRPFFSKFAILYALKPLQRNFHIFVDTCEL